MTEAEQVALNKVEGLKQYEVMAKETVYYSKVVWAKDELDAQSIMNRQGYELSDIYDSAYFEYTDTEEVSDE